MIGFAVSIAPLSDLTDRTDVTDQLDAADYRKPLNDYGAGSLTVPYGETITPAPEGNVAFFTVDGVDVGCILVESKADTKVDRDGYAEMVTQYVGEGIAAILKHYRFRPVLGFGRSPFARRRAYTPFSLEFDYSGWGTATEFGTVGADSPHWGEPSGFPDGSVPRIGPAEGDDEGAPQGYMCWQDEFTLDEGIGLARFDLVDNSQDPYLQSFQLDRIKLDGQVGSFTVAQRYDFDYVSPGTIRVGGRVVNVPFGGGDPGPGEGPELDGNPMMVACVIYKLFPDGRLGDEVFRTSSATKILPYPATPPGMTDLEVIEACIADNPNAHPVTVVDHGTFDPQPSITVRVGGDNLLQHLRNRADAQFIDWNVEVNETGDVELHVWPSGERGTPSGVEWVTDDGTLENLVVTSLHGGPDCVHVAYQGGDVLVGDPDGERMAYLETDAATVDEAKARGEAALAVPNPVEYRLDVAPVTGKVPGVDVADGDTVTAGEFTDLRLNEWRLSWPDDNGEPSYNVDVGDRIREKAERQALVLERSSPGHMGGNQPANPAPDSGFIGRRSTFESIKFNVDKDPAASYVTGEAPVDNSSSTSLNVCAFRFYAKNLTGGTATIEAKIGGTTVATASLTTADAPFLSTTVYMDELHWVVPGKTKLTIEITSVGSGLEGIVCEFLGVI